MLPHALERVPAWCRGWKESGRLVLLLDFDGTLAPIVERPELAAMPDATRASLDRLMAMPGVQAAVVSGRGLADVRERAAVPGIAYAGNHGMEIEGAGLRRMHPDAVAARPSLQAAARMIEPALSAIPGAFVEDKGMTLSIHFRQAAPGRHDEVRDAVERVVRGDGGLRVTTGKMVLEVRPRVDWDKGKAVLFLLGHIRPPFNAPVLYLGDDRTDEDAFRALAGLGGAGQGVLIGDPAAETAARSYLRDPAEVAELFAALAQG
jgi:trehalose 6-phosphate phosphatase